MSKTDEPAPRIHDDAGSPLFWEPSLALLKYAIAVNLFGAFVFLIVARFVTPDQPARVVGPALLAMVAVIAWYLLSRHRMHASVNVLAIGVWMVITGVSAFNGGVRAPIVVAYPLMILLFGWLISRRAAAAVAVLTVAAIVGLVLFESWGLLPYSPPSPPALHGVVQVSSVVLAALTVIFVVHAYLNRLKELSQIGSDLTRRTRDLETSRAELNQAQAVAAVGNWVYDIGADKMRLSAETCRIFALPEGTTGSYDAYLARTHVQDRCAVDRAWQAALQGEPFDQEHRIVAGNAIRWIRQKAEFEFAADGTALRAVGITQDITERKKAEERIEELAYFDSLTQLPNRTLLLDRLKQAVTASSRIGTCGGVLFIDLDNFKTLNDTRGHDKGDLLLLQVARRLSGCVREGDTVARLGGDEFVVVLGSLNGNRQEAAAATEAIGMKILASLKQAYQLEDIDYRCTASIGATLFHGHETSSEDLLKQADLAMYKSKEKGRNALNFFDPTMQTAVMERAALEDDLRRSLTAKQLLLHYHAQVVGEDHVTGAEVLVRWQHPQRGVVPPAEFIPLAEETGLILQLGEWVLETACVQLASWATRPKMAHLTIAVNISARQFRQPDFVEQVLAILNATGANPRRLKLELTETLLVSNVEDVIEKMFALKAKGVGFALDDFGTGYSSLSYLKRLPLDQLKIDQSFVRDVLSDPNDAAIAKTIIALAQSLGLGVIAEGVETAAQRDFLASAGCHAYQGYFFSRPLSLEGFEQLAQRV